MKKFISMVMAAAMVVSLVPATAFAKGDLTAKAKVIDAIEWSEAEAAAKKNTTFAKDGGLISGTIAPEIRYEITSAEYKDTNNNNEFADLDITLTLDNAKFLDGAGAIVVEDGAVALEKLVSINTKTATTSTANAITIALGTTTAPRNIVVTATAEDDNEIKYNFKGQLMEDDVIGINLASVLDDVDAGTVATVTVDSELASLDDVAYASVLDSGIKVSCKGVADVAVEEEAPLKKDLKIEAIVGTFAQNQEIELKLSKGFEFVESKLVPSTGAYWSVVSVDENEATIKVNATGAGKDTITIKAADMVIEAVSAKADDVCTVTVKTSEDKAVDGSFDGKATVEIAKVVADAVIVSVDEDDDVPVIYSGVDVDNTGITDDSDHLSLKVTVEESVPDSWDFKKAFDVELPEGVFVTDVKVNKVKNMTVWDSTTAVGTTEVKDAFAKAYVDGDQENFEFGRKLFDAKKNEKVEIEFQLELVAEPGFEGDVVLTAAEQEVVIAKFVAPYTVEAAQNDMIIDYRYTEVPTSIVVKEAEAGLWDEGTAFWFDAERMQFEDDSDITVDEESEMEVETKGMGKMGFYVDEKSDDEAAVVTISGMSLYMERTLPAGAYDLLLSTSMLCDVAGTPAKAVGYLNQSVLKTATKGETVVAGVTDVVDTWNDTINTVKVVDGSYTVKEGFVNVITAGRDQDDASFTKKVVVPVGEAYIVAGEETVALDVPAYISAAGYTMLPVRAVAVALGINNNNVLWDQATKTVTILYGQRIITMVAGQKVVYVNGSAIPASASVEIKDGRTFLPMRDLATALGVTDITWDAATKTATLNGNK